MKQNKIKYKEEFGSAQTEDDKGPRTEEYNNSTLCTQETKKMVSMGFLQGQT